MSQGMAYACTLGLVTLVMFLVLDLQVDETVEIPYRELIWARIKRWYEDRYADKSLNLCLEPSNRNTTVGVWMEQAHKWMHCYYGPVFSTRPEWKVSILSTLRLARHSIYGTLFQSFSLYAVAKFLVVRQVTFMRRIAILSVVSFLAPTLYNLMSGMQKLTTPSEIEKRAQYLFWEYLRKTIRFVWTWEWSVDPEFGPIEDPRLPAKFVLYIPALAIVVHAYLWAATVVVISLARRLTINYTILKAHWKTPICYLCMVTSLMMSYAVCMITGEGMTSSYRMKLSLFLNRCNLLSEFLKRNAARLRPSYKNEVFPQTTQTLGDHPTATAERNTFTMFATAFARRNGYRPWHCQASHREQTLGLNGCRSCYDVRDLNLRVKEDPLQERDLVIMTDVDYYLNMPEWLSQHPLPHLIYTLQPEALSGKPNGSTFTFTGKQCTMRVTGGGKYQHPIWAYSADAITVTSGWGLHKQSTVYTVSRMRVSEHRYSVLLVPKATYVGISAYLLALMNQMPLQQLETKTEANFEWIDVALKDGTDFRAIRSIRALTGENCSRSVEVTDKTLATLASVKAISSRPITGPTVLSHMKCDNNQEAVADSVILAHFLRTCSLQDAAEITAAGNETPRLRNYKRAECISDDDKPSLHAYMDPLIGNMPYAPYKCRANDEACVKTRLTDVMHHKPVEITPQLLGYQNEFLNYLLDGQEHTLAPKPVEEVYENMPRPGQQATLEEANVSGYYYVYQLANRMVRSFQKAEAYPDAKDPRNISTINPVDKLGYSRYTYALAEHVKRFKWYSFGRKPKEIAERVAHICKRSQFVALGDFSRMDGRVSNAGRGLTDSFVAEIFHADYTKEAVEFARSQYNLKASTAHGVKYHTGWTRLSGSPETSLFNTIENAFVVYVSLRLSGLNHEMSIFELSESVAVGGDDSIIGNVEEKYYNKAAQMLGHVTTCDIVQRGELGVNYLARFYSPQVWTGELNSVSDPRRQLSKFHTASKPVPTDDLKRKKMIEKSLSVMFTDRNSPVLGAFARKVLEVCDAPIPESLHRISADTSWWAAFHVDDIYPNECDEWAKDLLHKQIPTFDFDAFHEYLATCETLSDLMTHKPFSEPTPLVENTKHTVVVEENGDEMLVNREMCRLCGKICGTCTARRRTCRHCKRRNADHHPRFCMENPDNTPGRIKPCKFCKHPNPGHAAKFCHSNPQRSIPEDEAKSRPNQPKPKAKEEASRLAAGEQKPEHQADDGDNEEEKSLSHGSCSSSDIVVLTTPPIIRDKPLSPAVHLLVGDGTPTGQ